MKDQKRNRLHMLTIISPPYLSNFIEIYNLYLQSKKPQKKRSFKTFLLTNSDSANTLRNTVRKSISLWFFYHGIVLNVYSNKTAKQKKKKNTKESCLNIHIPWNLADLSTTTKNGISLWDSLQEGIKKMWVICFLVETMGRIKFTMACQQR